MKSILYIFTLIAFAMCWSSCFIDTIEEVENEEFLLQIENEESFIKLINWEVIQHPTNPFLSKGILEFSCLCDSYSEEQKSNIRGFYIKSQYDFYAGYFLELEENVLNTEYVENHIIMCFKFRFRTDSNLFENSIIGNLCVDFE